MRKPKAPPGYVTAAQAEQLFDCGRRTALHALDEAERKLVAIVRNGYRRRDVATVARKAAAIGLIRERFDAARRELDALWQAK